MPAVLMEGEEVVVADGQRLVREGERGDFYIVLSGELQVLKKAGDQEMLLATHQPGAFFGELPLLLDVPFSPAEKQSAKCACFASRKTRSGA
jgi:CRP-like cAMP-binding protein